MKTYKCRIALRLSAREREEIEQLIRERKFKEDLSQAIRAAINELFRTQGGYNSVTSRHVEFLVKLRDASQMIADATSEFIESMAPPELGLENEPVWPVQDIMFHNTAI